MNTIIDSLKDAVDDNGMTVDENALFELISTGMCTTCCDHAAIGGNDGCKPDA